MPKEDHLVLELSQWRDRLAKTQKQVAQEAGVGLAALRTWEQGSNYPHPSARAKLADYFHVEPWQIIYKKRTPKAEAVGAAA